MTMETFSIRMDTSQLDSFARVLKEKKSVLVRELLEEGRKQKALALYRDGRVSLGLAAKLAGLSLSEFFDLLKERQFTLQLDDDDVRDALATARKVW